jgi:5-methylthioadenosine/S-adenosylhomocysteine deaminase
VSDNQANGANGRDPAAVDLLVTNATAILGGANGEQYRVVPGTTIEVTAGTITRIEPDDPGRAAGPARTIDARGRLVVPGLISTHNHAFQNLCKGIGDELAVWPIVEGVILATAEEMNADEIHVAALACCVEGMRSGRTALLDFMVGLPNIELQRAVLRAFEESGIRGLLGRATRELHHEASHRDPWYIPLEEALDQITALASEYSNGLPTPSALPAPGNPRTMTTEGLIRIAEYAEEQGCLITTHLAEYDAERTEGQERWGMSTIAKLEEIGFLGPRLVAAHSTILDDAELEALARSGTKVSYNPVSNCYCGVGVAPIVPMLEMGIDVSVAVDGASVNCQNMLESLKFGALLQKTYYGDAMAINARDMLKLATLGGASALGAPDLLGALEVGRLADFFLFDPAHLATTPVHDPISAVVYAGTPQNVDTVVVGGEVLLDEGRCTRVDEAALIEEMQERAIACSIRTGTTRFVKDRRLTPFGKYERVGHRRPLHRKLDAEPPSVSQARAQEVRVVSLSTAAQEVVDGRNAR